MRVEITRVLDQEKRRVRFRSACGSAVASWKGEGAVREGLFDVELEISDEVVSWSSVTNVGGSVSGGLGERDLVTLVGDVIGVDEDGDVAEIRVCDDVVLVEIPQVQSSLSGIDAVSLTVRELHLYPYDL